MGGAQQAAHAATPRSSAPRGRDQKDLVFVLIGDLDPDEQCITFGEIERAQVENMFRADGCAGFRHEKIESETVLRFG